MKKCGGTDNWSEIAKLVGHGATAEQCSTRWCRYVNPEFEKCKHGRWTDEEVCLLMPIKRISHNTLRPLCCSKFVYFLENTIRSTGTRACFQEKESSTCH